MKPFLAEPLASEAIRLLAELSARPEARAHVPTLFYAECANVLWKAVGRFRLPAETAMEHWRDVAALDLERHAVEDITEQALKIALAYGVSAYDGCYVALSVQLSASLITADDALIEKLRGAPFTLLHLGEIAV
jgi:predicted nucleic acid-binding protein